MTEATDIGTCSPVILLSELVEKFLALKNIEKKKYFSKYLIVAGEIWKDIFQKTLWTTKSVWKELKDGDPYPYIDIPRDSTRIFSVATTDKCGNIQPLYYNSQLNIIPKPTVRRCSCAACDCDVCGDINAASVYYERIIYYKRHYLLSEMLDEVLQPTGIF